jgi:DNA-binding IclR family transcriptional regulator
MVRPRTHPIKTVAALERALLVLDVFKDGAPSRSLAEVVAATGLLKTTVFRILLTFENSGHLVRLADGRYQLGGVFMQLGMAYRQAFRLDDHIKPVLRRLMQATGEGVSFYVREGDSRLCLLRADSPQPVRDIAPAGTLLPIDDTAASQVLRDFQHEKYDARRSDGRELRVTAGKGNTPQVSSAAAPIFGVNGLLGALSVSGPRERFTAQAITVIRAKLLDESTALSRRLSGALLEPAGGADSIPASSPAS